MPYDPARHGPERIVGPGFHEKVYRLVKRVPRGRVTTYGDVAEALGLRTAARQVGYALAALPPSRTDVPWHRVVNGRGRLSLRSGGDRSSEQERRLRAEGIEVVGGAVVRDFASLRHHFRAATRARRSSARDRRDR